MDEVTGSINDNMLWYTANRENSSKLIKLYFDTNFHI